jgi:hypothetical protein
MEQLPLQMSAILLRRLGVISICNDSTEDDLQLSGTIRCLFKRFLSFTCSSVTTLR